jgi:hypothetical protein
MMNDEERRHLAELDQFHMKKGDYEHWMTSEERTYFAGDQKVRVINSTNLHELCVKAGLDESKVQAAYAEALETGDILFVTYEEPDASAHRG